MEREIVARVTYQDSFYRQITKMDVTVGELDNLYEQEANGHIFMKEIDFYQPPKPSKNLTPTQIISEDEYCLVCDNAMVRVYYGDDIERVRCMKCDEIRKI